MGLTELLLPGSPFAADNCLRLPYATSMKNITGGMDRIEEFEGSDKIKQAMDCAACFRIT